jgi:hypothetical protein
MKNEIKFKDMPTIGKLKKFIEQRLNCHNDSIIIKIAHVGTYSVNACIFDVLVPAGQMFFTPSFCHVQSVSNYGERVKITLTISNNVNGYWSILNENNFFKRNPADLERTNSNRPVKLTTF